MLLTVQQTYALLAKHGCYIREICDSCGKGIGPICFTRKDSKGVWCSRLCRDGAGAREPGTCKFCKAVLPAGKRKGAGFCDDNCRQAARRAKPDNRPNLTAKTSVTKASIGVGFGGVLRPGCYGDSQRPQNGLIADTLARGAQH